MNEDLVNRLAIVLYTTWQRSGRLKTTWHDLPPTHVVHWRNVATAALSWMEDFIEEQEDIAPIEARR